MQVLDRLANCLHTNFSTKKSCSGCIATASLDDLDLVLLKPTVPMNVNGTSVKQTGKVFSNIAIVLKIMHNFKEKWNKAIRGHNNLHVVLTFSLQLMHPISNINETPNFN